VLALRERLAFARTREGSAVTRDGRDFDTFDRDRARSNLLPYTRRAFALLPKLSHPRILDIGCGSGVVTLELAHISGGTVVALDYDRSALDRLVQRAKAEGLVDRITVVNRPMQEMSFPHGSFDIVWSEGAIVNVGFERGLRAWRELLAPKGYLVVHDGWSDLQRKTKLTRTCGYTIAGQFELSPEIWWSAFYAPLQQQLDALKQSENLSPSDLSAMETAAREIRAFDREREQFGSVFFILRKLQSEEESPW
jgi:cyclopropane fatty-acyl-phospholipid synthase-like methyltransferase